MEELVKIGVKMIENLKGLSNLEAILIMFFSIFIVGVFGLSRFLWKYWIKYSEQIAEERKTYAEERKYFAEEAKKDRNSFMLIYSQQSTKMEELADKVANAINGSSKAIESNTNTMILFNEKLHLNNELIKELTSAVTQQTLTDALRKTG